MTTSVIARVDFENNAEEFWAAFREQVETLDQYGELAATCYSLLRCNEVELTDANAVSEFDAFVTKLPGWESGPEHARTAIVFEAAAEGVADE